MAKLARTPHGGIGREPAWSNTWFGQQVLMGCVWWSLSIVYAARAHFTFNLLSL